MNTDSINTATMRSGSAGAGGISTNPHVRTFAWLLKREFWEHRGGFMRAPFIIAIVIICLFVAGLITADVSAHRTGVNIGGLNIGAVADKMSPDAADKVAAGLDAGLFAMCMPIMIGLTFVTFFYLLGALYDDRRDRSVLFFKSLPISDTTTVLSKVVSALLIAPLFAVAASIALNIVFLLLTTAYTLVHGMNIIALIWRPSHLLGLWLKLILLIPINALWALPTVGWVLLCSAYVRSKPFLAAVLLPILVGFVVNWVNVMQAFALPSMAYWRYGFFRIVLSLIPGSWVCATSADGVTVDTSGSAISIGLGKLDFLNGVISINRMLGILLTPELWIGVAAGAALIAAAIYFRQKRTEAYS